MEREISITIKTRGPEETRAEGTRLGRLLTTGDLALLTGSLGAGKTTFVQGLCRGLGVNASIPVRSPTFTIIHEYRGACPIRHIDLYRIDSAADLETIGLFDANHEGVTVVEWAEKMPDQDYPGRILIDIQDISETEREIVIRGPANRLERL